MFGISSLLTLAFTTFVIAASLDKTSSSGNSPEYTIVKNASTGSTLSYVTNSDVCETTPGVNQYSGYFSDSEGRVNNSSLHDDIRLADAFSAYMVLVLRSTQRLFYCTPCLVAQWGPWL